MAQRRTLTEQQVSVLHWIDEGCPEGVMENDFHRISAAALRRRDLVTTKGHGASWSARITKAGRDYLDAVDGPSPPTPRQGNRSVTQQLVDEVVAAGGALRIPFDAGRTIIDIERRARLAERHNRLPPNTRFQTRRVERAFEISLVEVPDPGPRPVLVDLTVPESVTRFHPAARAFRDARARHEVSQEALRRATLIVHAIAVEAERRGWKASAPQPAADGYGRAGWAPTKHGHLRVDAATRTFLLRLREEDVRVRGGSGKPRSSGIPTSIRRAAGGGTARFLAGDTTPTPRATSSSSCSASTRESSPGDRRPGLTVRLGASRSACRTCSSNSGNGSSNSLARTRTGVSPPKSTRPSYTGEPKPGSVNDSTTLRELASP